MDGKADRTALQGELKSAKEITRDNKEAEERMTKEMERLRKIHEEELLQLRKEHQQKVGSLFSPVSTSVLFIVDTFRNKVFVQ